MPNSNTFTIKPIAELLARYCIGHGADAFARNSKWANLTNDLDPTTSATSHMDAADFMRSIPDASLDYFLFDPPYSPRQVSECYRALGKTVTMETTQARFWSRMKREIARTVKPGGHCLTFVWLLMCLVFALFPNSLFGFVIDGSSRQSLKSFVRSIA